MSKGWIKLYRKTIDSCLFSDEYLLQLWTYLLLSVNREQKKIIFNDNELIILPGSGIFGLNQIVTDIKKISNQKTKKFKKFKTIYYRRLKVLEKLRKVELQPTNKFTIITITKWLEHQQNETQVKLQCNSGVTPVKTNKNQENQENQKKNNIYTPNFLSFWKTYPKKEGKGAAFKAYQNIKEPKPTLQHIVESITEHQQKEQWQTKQFIPFPATWINQRRWEDEVSEDDSIESMDQYLKRKGLDNHGNPRTV